MAEEFKAITTQEAFDAAISARLNRQKETLEQGFAAERETLQKTIRDHEKTIGTLQGSVKDFEGKLADRDKTIGTLREQVQGFERTALTERVAEAAGLSRGFAARLKGETEEELAADAKELAKLLAPVEETKPQADPVASYGGKGGVDAAWGEMLAGLGE